jgi:hypothetical protein
MSIYFVDFTQFITMWSAFLIRACGSCELKALVTGENVLGCCGDEHLKRCLNDLEVPNEQRGNACQPLAHLRRMGTPQNKRVSMSSQVHFGLKLSWNFWQSHGTKMYKSYPQVVWALLHQMIKFFKWFGVQVNFGKDHLASEATWDLDPSGLSVWLQGGFRDQRH